MSDKINNICVNILSISDKEIESMKEIIEGQKFYNNPLKMGTTARQNTLGKANELVLNSIIETKRLIEEASPDKLFPEDNNA
jgi:hypothetical protein